VSAEVEQAEAELQAMAQADSTFMIATPPMARLEWEAESTEDHPGMAYYEHRNDQLKAESSYEVQRLLPDISLDYFVGSNSGLDEQLYGYQLGLKIPLFFQGNASRIKASGIAREAGIRESENYERQLLLERDRLIKQLGKHENALSFYEEDGRRLSEEIRKTAGLGYSSGEITFFEYIQSLENANEVELSYLEALHMYNQTVIALSYLIL
jgi:cobalt-zinc-cadmium resistance protein CzcA